MFRRCMGRTRYGVALAFTLVLGACEYIAGIGPRKVWEGDPDAGVGGSGGSFMTDASLDAADAGGAAGVGSDADAGEPVWSCRGTAHDASHDVEGLEAVALAVTAQRTSVVAWRVYPGRDLLWNAVSAEGQLLHSSDRPVPGSADAGSPMLRVLPDGNIALAYSVLSKDRTQITTAVRRIEPASWSLGEATFGEAHATVSAGVGSIPALTLLGQGPQTLVVGSRPLWLDVDFATRVDVFDPQSLAPQGSIAPLSLDTRGFAVTASPDGQHLYFAYLEASETHPGVFVAYDTAQPGATLSPRRFTLAAQLPVAAVESPLSVVAHSDQVLITWLNYQARGFASVVLTSVPLDGGPPEHIDVTGDATENKTSAKIVDDGTRLVIFWLVQTGNTTYGHLYLRAYDYDLQPLSEPICATCDSVGPVSLTNYWPTAVADGEYRSAHRVPQALGVDLPAKLLSIRCSEQFEP